MKIIGNVKKKDVVLDVLLRVLRGKYLLFLFLLLSCFLSFFSSSFLLYIFYDLKIHATKKLLVTTRRSIQRT